MENQSNGLRKAVAALTMKPKETQSLDRRWNPRNPEKPRLVGVGWALRWRTRRRHGLAAWGLGQLGLVTMRLAEAWIGDVETERWEWLKERDTEWLRVWERESLFIILINGNFFFFFCSQLQHRSKSTKKYNYSSTARACFLCVRS